MDNSIKVLSRINKKDPGHYEMSAPTGKIGEFFSIQEKMVPLTDENARFIGLLNKTCSNDYKEFSGLDRFYFDVGSGVLEILFSIDFATEQVRVEPFIYYEEEEIAQHLQRVMYREFKLFCLLKKWGLQ